MIPQQCSKTQTSTITTNQNQYLCSSKFTGNHDHEQW